MPGRGASAGGPGGRTSLSTRSSAWVWVWVWVWVGVGVWVGLGLGLDGGYAEGTVTKRQRPGCLAHGT